MNLVFQSATRAAPNLVKSAVTRFSQGRSSRVVNLFYGHKNADGQPAQRISRVLIHGVINASSNDAVPFCSVPAGRGPRKPGPRYLALSNPIRNHSQDGNALLRDRGQRFVAAVHMSKDGIDVQILDSYYTPSYCETGVRGDPTNYNCTDAAGYDYMLISKGVSLFQDRFAYNLDGTMAYVEQQVAGETPVLCPQVIASDTQSYEDLVKAGASVGSLVGFRVGLSMQGAYCRNVKSTAAATYLR